MKVIKDYNIKKARFKVVFNYIKILLSGVIITSLGNKLIVNTMVVF